MEQKEVLLETVLQQNTCVINDVYVKEHVTFFSVNGHRFCTHDNKVYHKNNVYYDHTVTYLSARATHDPEGIQEQDFIVKECEIQNKMWDKHKSHLYKVIFSGAIEVLKREGSEAFEKYIDDNLIISPGDGALSMLNTISK